MRTALSFLSGAVLLGVLVPAAWSGAPLRSTAPEPATSPSQAATQPQPATAPSEQLGPAATVQYTFEMLDANADGRITRREAEAAAWLQENFELLDRNRDGALDRSEFVRFTK